MFDTSKDIFWIVLSASIGTFTGFLSLVLYRVSQILQESQKTVKDVNSKLEKSNEVFDEAISTTSSLMKTIKAIDTGILKPIMNIGNAASGILSIFRK